MAAANKNSKNSLIDIAADLVGGSGINLDTVVDIATTVAGASKKSSSSSRKKKESKSDSLISKLVQGKVDYPQFSEKTYWALRDIFQESIPEKVTASTLTAPTGLKADTIMSTVLPALALMGLLKDGKPTTKLKTWTNDDKYEDACESIRESVYPDSLLKMGFGTEAQEGQLLKWFIKNAGVSESTAKKMLAIYMLLRAPQLKEKAKARKAPSTAKKPGAGALKKLTGAPDVTVKAVKKMGKATITVKVVADEKITKKALTDLMASAAAEAYNQLK